MATKKKPAAKKPAPKKAAKPVAKKPAAKPVAKKPVPKKAVKHVQKKEVPHKHVEKPVVKKAELPAPQPVKPVPVIKKGEKDPKSLVSVKPPVKSVMKKDPPKPSKVVIPKTTTSKSVNHKLEFSSKESSDSEDVSSDDEQCILREKSKLEITLCR